MSQSASRIDWHEFQKLAPGAYAAISALSKAISASGLEHDLLELLKLRASQINGCAFCTQFHLNEGRKLGIPQVKFDLLAVWREAGIFSAREQAAFAWTEKLTAIAGSHVTDEDYAAIAAHFPPAELAHLTAAIGLINTWNRIAGPLRFTPLIPQSAKEPAKEPVHA
jgi:AhpD family alkylhydroperoxidase